MNTPEAVDYVIELTRQAILTTLLICAPVLIAGMIVGILVGLAQAVTQIQEQAVSFVPKLLVMVLVLSLTLPWLINQMVQYSHDVIANIPNNL
jgi:flagellar biosynthesis protein FliQ